MKVKLFEQDTPLLRTVHFLSGSGGWRDLGGGGGHEKNMALKGGKGGGQKKHSGRFKGAVTKKILKILQ